MARIQRNISASRPSSRSSAGEPSGASSPRRGRKVPLKHLVRFTRLLATLTEAGLPVLRNLRILADQWPEGRFRDSILDSADMVEEGQTMSDALAQNPDVFDELFVNMARAGEAGGVLDAVLSRLADFLERSQSMRDRTRGALAYPLVIFVVAISVVAGLMGFVIPKFSELYADMNLELPGITQALIDMSDTFKAYWYLFLGLPASLVFLYKFFYSRSFGFRYKMHALLLRVPIAGHLTEIGQVTRFASTFGTLVASGVPHLRAFDILSGALDNEVYREAVEDIREEVREGESIASAMSGTGRFDDVVVSMVEVGEETGELDRMCLRIGKSYEEDHTRALDIMLKMIEPAMLIVMAGAVGSIAFAIFLPLFKLLEEFGQGM
jgi:type IV pilus assembly protein PilC